MTRSLQHATIYGGLLGAIAAGGVVIKDKIDERHSISLVGKRIFLTGAAPAEDPSKHTLGELFARALRAEGANLFLVDREHRVQQLGEELDVAYHICDVTDRNKVQYVANLAAHMMGDIDIFIANAGVADITTFENDPERYLRIQAVNETGVYNTIRACMPYMKGENSHEKYGLVNASNGGIVPLALMMAYNASKAHAIKLAECCNLELRGTGARCGVLLLSEHASPMEDNFKKHIPRKLMNDNWLLRLGHKERDARHAVDGMLRAVKGRRLYTSVPRYSEIARHLPSVVGTMSRAMHRRVQPAMHLAREEYTRNM